MMDSPSQPITVSAFYKFVAIDEPETLRDLLFARLEALSMKGTILLAREGINGTISGERAALATFMAELRAEPRFADLVTKDAAAAAHPFGRLKVKVKPEILSFRRPDADPSVRVGTYVAPEDWNALIADPDVVVLDTRNAYEVEVGTFARAIDPKTRTFTEFPDWVRDNLDPARHPKIAMFCTGGIRCEKASAYLLSLGFPAVYHLEGGILKDLARVPRDESLWQGACFVFDARREVEGD